MLVSGHRTKCVVYAFASLVGLAILAGCAGHSGDHQNWNEQELNSALISEVQALDLPEVNGRLAETLKDELLRSISAYGRDKVTSTPPCGAENCISDLSSAPDGVGGRKLTWSYRNVGDYDQNSEVNAADITPVGMHYGATSSSPDWEAARLADGDENTEVNVADITAIGRNFRSSCSLYRIYYSVNESDYPESFSADNGPGTAFAGEVTMAEYREGPGGCKTFSYPLGSVAAGTFFWVRPFDGLTEGSPSNLYEIPGTGNLQPVAALSADPAAGDIPMVVQLDASASYDPDGTITKYEWDWDGAANGWVWFDSGIESTQQHEYRETGAFNAAVRVFDNDGDTDVALAQISVTEPGNDPPVALLEADPLVGEAPLPVSFDASSSYDPDGLIEDYQWDFDGDEIYSETGAETDALGCSTAAFTYTESGTYMASVQAVDDSGGTDTTSVEVQVTEPENEPPVAMLTADPTSGEKPLDVSFDASESYDPDGEIADYEWDLDGDGVYNETGNEADSRDNPAATYTYTESGGYLAAVRITDDDGANEQATAAISVSGVGEWIIVEMDDVYCVKTSIAVIDGTPGIAFVDYYMGSLYQYYTKSATATGLNEEDWCEPVYIDTETGVVHRPCTLLEIAGNPAICYSIYGGEADTRYARSVTSSGTAEADWSQKVGIWENATDANMLIVDGNPAICWGSGWDLYYTRATTPTGASSADWIEPFIILDGG